MIIDQAKWDAYFGAGFTPGFPNSQRLESQIISFFNRVFPNIPNYDDITDTNCIEKYEWALMEQMVFWSDNEDLQNGVIATGGGFSIGKYSESGNSEQNVDINSNSKRISPSAYDYLAECGYTYMGIGGC
jgi:hypothetical protein